MERGDDGGFHNTKLGGQRSELGSQPRGQFGIPRVGEGYGEVKMARVEFGARDEVFSDTARDFGSEYEPRPAFMRRPLRSDIDGEAGGQLNRSNGARGGFNNGAGAGLVRQRPNNIGAGGSGGGFDNGAGGQFGSERRSGSQRYISKQRAGNPSRFVEEEEQPYTREEELQLTRSVLAIMEEDAIAGNQQNPGALTLAPSKRKALESEFSPSYEISASYVGPVSEYTERETKSNLGLYDRSIHPKKKTKADVCEARVNTLNAQAAAAKAMAEAMVRQVALLKERNVLLLMTSRAHSPAGKEYIRLRQAEELEKYKDLLAEEALREQEVMEAAAESDIGEEA